MDIKNLYEKSERELNESNSKLAVIDDNINKLAKELNLDPEKDLLEQAIALAQSCEADKKSLEEELDAIVSKMEATNLSTDEADFN